MAQRRGQWWGLWGRVRAAWKVFESGPARLCEISLKGMRG